MKNLALLGSTGSIGKQTLEVIRETSCARVRVLTAGKNITLLESQIEQFLPDFACVSSEKDAAFLSKRLRKKGIQTEVFFGDDGLVAAATLESCDTVLNALVGAAGIRSTYAAVDAKKTVALANKESLVAAGAVIIPLAQKNDVRIIPVDSEHSAIFQCLSGNNNFEKIYLTASGGPFRGKTKQELQNVTAADALRHPNWTMGAKITIDSATLMNKGLEFIEAAWLFDALPNQIEILVHPQSIIHSMVCFADGAVIAQLGAPDMRVPIQYALTFPERQLNSFPRADFFAIKNLTFEKPDYETFPCLKIAIDAFKQGGTVPAVANAANEVAVAKFLRGEIKFYDIPQLIESTINAYIKNNKTRLKILDDVLTADKIARQICETFYIER